ncbi:MAG: ABC transporter permease [Bacteroidota bacterium]
MKLYEIALKNLKRRKARTLFMIAGLTLAVATEIALITLTRTMQKDLSRKLDEYGANILIIPKTDELSLDYGGISVSGVAFDVKELSDSDVQKIRTIKNSENISTVAPKFLHPALIDSKRIFVAGVDFKEEFRLKRWWKIIGRLPRDSSDALVGEEASTMLGLTQNQEFRINGAKFTVAGVLRETGSQDDKLIFIPLKKAQELSGKKDAVTMIEVSALCYNCPIEEIVRQIQEKLPNAKVTALRQTIESRMDVMHRFEHFSAGLVVVILLISIFIFFSNTMSSVNDRTREIGILRAVGFKQRHVIFVFVSEALILSLAAGLIGYLTGLSVAKFISPTIGISSPVGIDYLLLAISVLSAVTVGLVASFYPAYKASTLDPTAALRTL